VTPISRRKGENPTYSRKEENGPEVGRREQLIVQLVIKTNTFLRKSHLEVEKKVTGIRYRADNNREREDTEGECL